MHFMSPIIMSLVWMHYIREYYVNTSYRKIHGHDESYTDIRYRIYPPFWRWTRLGCWGPPPVAGSNPLLWESLPYPNPDPENHQHAVIVTCSTNSPTEIFNNYNIYAQGQPSITAPLIPPIVTVWPLRHTPSDSSNSKHLSVNQSINP